MAGHDHDLDDFDDTTGYVDDEVATDQVAVEDDPFEVDQDDLASFTGRRGALPAIIAALIGVALLLVLVVALGR